MRKYSAHSDSLTARDYVNIEIDAATVLDWILEESDRKNYFLNALLIDNEETITAPPSHARQIAEMPSLERDRFLADLCRECALLGIEWPASPKDETQRISK